MDIILQGQHTTDETADNLISALRLFKEHYHIEQFREIHLTLTLVDERGDDVELVDSDTAQVYRVVEICRSGYQLRAGRRVRPILELVIDNTR